MAKRFGRFLIGLPAERKVYELLSQEALDNTDDDQLSDNLTAEAQASWLNGVFFIWFQSIIDLAAARTSLALKHIPKLLDKHDPEVQSLDLQSQWRAELERSKRKSTFGYRPSHEEKEKRDKSKEIEEEDITWEVKEIKPPSLVKAMYLTFRWEYLQAFIPRLIKAVGSFVGPWMIKMIISLIENPERSAKSTVWGMFLLMILSLNLIISSAALQKYWHIAAATSIHMKSGITSLLYEKLLRLSAKAKQSNVAGKLTNLIASDVTRLQDTVTYLHFLWATPLMMIICFILVSLIMGVLPTLAGFGVFFAFAPASAYVAWTLEKIRAQCVLLTDTRVKATNEIFATIKTVKVYALEDLFTDTSNKARESELRTIRKFQLWKAVHNTLNFSLVPLMTVATFVVFIAYHKTGFTASSAFSVISLYYVLKWPFSMLAQVVSNIVESRVSIRRIEEFLALPELPGVPSSHGVDLGEIRINRASFSWDVEAQELSGAPPDLQHISLHCKPGTLTCIIGPVGAGKSSLLNVILGEIEQTNSPSSKNAFNGNHFPENSSSASEIPSCAVNGTVCYAPQTPFLSHATVRENILFGKPYDEKKYFDTISSCALQTDFDMLIAGDMTAIGERGINLSGGQKARIAMARAVYSDADIYLLDDPLSAVDAHVGHKLFNDAIKGILKHKTVVLVTHQLQFVTHGDQLVIMQHGQITNSGTPSELKDQGVLVEALLEKFNASLETSDSASNASSSSSSRNNYTDNNAENNNHPKKQANSMTTSSEIANQNGNSQFPGLLAPIATGGDVSLTSQSSSLIAPSPIAPEPGTMQPTKNSTDYEAVASNGNASTSKEENGIDKKETLQERQKEAATSKANVEQKEERAVGHISFAVYKFYFGQKLKWWIIALLLILLHRGIDIFLKVWIADWSDKQKPNAPNPPPNNATMSMFSMSSSIQGPRYDASEEASTYLGFVNGATVLLSGGIDMIMWPLSGMITEDWTQVNAIGSVENQKEISDFGKSTFAGTEPTSKVSEATVKFLWVFVIGNLGLAVAQMIKESTILMVTCATGRAVYMSMFNRLLRAPMSFFDTTPKGRIAARFSSDTDAMDNQLGQILTTVCDNLAQLLGSLVSIALSVHWFVLGMIPMITGYVHFYNRFINAYRELTRLTGTTKAPIFSQFSETLNGLYTLRAYGAQERSVKRLYENLDANQRVYFSSVTAARWLGIRMDLLGAILISGVAFVALINRSINPGLMGMALSYCLLNTELINGFIRGLSDIESRMNSVERIEQYTKIDTERDAFISEYSPPSSWPSRGAITFDSVSLRYRQGLPLVLDGISFKIRAGEKIGIVGRTGAGKSSILTALLQLAELEGLGTITIDDYDISRVGVQQLRSRLSVIPQDPCIFDGNVRRNVDPFGDHNDAEIWETLRRVHLHDSIKSLPEGLDAQLADEGANLSLGQRQLLCVARAILRRSQILLLDEASSSIDLETDYLLQRTLRTEFSDCTTITIAHRLATIMDSDRVMVLEAGKVKEFDSPSSLLQNPNSTFYLLHQQAQSSSSASH